MRWLGFFGVLVVASTAFATDYTLSFTTNAAQDNILGKAYTAQAIELVSGGATTVPGCTITDLGGGAKEVTCSAETGLTPAMLQGYVRDYVVVPWFQSEKRKYANAEVAELMRKYENLPDAARQKIKQEAGIR